jgi:hypothetical protein
LNDILVITIKGKEILLLISVGTDGELLQGGVESTEGEILGLQPHRTQTSKKQESWLPSSVQNNILQSKTPLSKATKNPSNLF